MVGRLTGKRALVTGAGQGIGRAVALAMAAEDAQVIATSRSPDKLADLDRADAISVSAMDVTDDTAIKKTFAEVGPVDILVNCAGWVHSGTILDCDDADWARSLDQNVTACFRTMRAALPGMLARGSGSIVNIASVASSITGVANRAAYGASKAALIGLSKAVARDFIGQGIRCNVLAPGTTESPSLNERINATPDPAATRAAFIARQPMGRLGTLEEMAAACVYLASDESTFTTGTVLVVDGGQTL
ncbi:SDR family oxidoreductase [Peteryoungia desertarenae]|uniref:SDR family oxidoreductase n=1 Tax=Peteryoungia desertarenae TaxID=1813451 RepID=A0ABX6QPX7_9HYPH|nr:SDR family oxidoreductase [Peteryoungia desertarenae]QLF70544.1 SDR family oxidoreductase [Peteryoungia desertarenae]